MSESNLPNFTNLEFYCPECHSRLTEDLIPTLLQRNPVYCEVCGTLYPTPVIPLPNKMESTPIVKKEVFDFFFLGRILTRLTDRLKSLGQRLKARFQHVMARLKNSFITKDLFLPAEWVAKITAWQNAQLERKMARRQLRRQRKLDRKLLRKQAKLDKKQRKIEKRQAIAMFYHNKSQENSQFASGNTPNVGSSTTIINSNPQINANIRSQATMISTPSPRFDPLTGRPLYSPVIPSPTIISAPLPEPQFIPMNKIDSSPTMSSKMESISDLDIREKRFDPMTGEPIPQPKVFTVLTPHQRNHILNLPISEEERQDLASICLYLDSDQIDHYLDVLEQVNSSKDSDLQPYVNKILKMNLSNEQKKGLIHQIEYIHARNRESFMLELEIAQTKDMLQSNTLASSHVKSDSEIEKDAGLEEDQPKENKKRTAIHE